VHMLDSWKAAVRWTQQAATEAVGTMQVRLECDDQTAEFIRITLDEVADSHARIAALEAELAALRAERKEE